MATPIDHTSTFTIGDWQATPALNLLQRDGHSIRIEPRAMEVLAYLVDRAGKVVAADELIAAVWQDRAGEGSVYRTINQLRHALGDDRQDVRYIQTIPKRGYRLVAAVVLSPQLERSDAAEVAPTEVTQRPALAIAQGFNLLTGQRLGYIISALLLVTLSAVVLDSYVLNDADALEGLVDVSGPVPGFSNRAAIAVLPFTNLSGDPEQEYFSDGITEEIIRELHSVRIFPIIGATSTFSYKGNEKDAREIAADLGAGYILDGSVRRAEGRVRITAQLVDASGRHVWSDNFESKLDDIFAVQEEITQQIVGAMAPEFLQVQMDLAHRVRPQDMQAWDFYLQAAAHATTFGGAFADRYGKPVTRERTEQAAALAREAIRLDSNFGEAYTLLGHILAAYSRQLSSEVGAEFAERTLKEAMGHIRHGYELDPFGATTCSCYVSFLAWTGPEEDFDLEAALNIQEEAVRVNPANAFAHAILAEVYQVHERNDEALEQISLAKRLSARDVGLSFFLSVEAGIHMSSRNWASAVSLAQSAIATGPLNLDAHVIRMVSFYARGDREQAALAAQDMFDAIPNFSADGVWNVPLPRSLVSAVATLQGSEEITRFREAVEAILNDLHSE